MRKTREVLRLKFELGLSHREVGRSLGLSPGTIAKTVARMTEAKLTWASAQAMSDEALEAKLYGAAAEAPSRPLPDFSRVHAEYRRVGVTLALLHEEYIEGQAGGYGYTQFCEFYRRWLGQRGLTMRQEHKAGEKLFVDYSGKRPHFIDRETGERVDVELFTAVLGASNYTYTEATRSQQLADWIGSHVRTFGFLGGVPRAVVPDQLKSGVTTACRYEPEINRTYAELAVHYDVAIVPARPGKPKDKAKVEGTVLLVQRWILARLRNQRFFSLVELNGRIAELNDDLNARVMRKYGYSRRQLFEQVERIALRALPVEPFEFAEFKKAKVGIDYHIEFDRHYYSLPYRLVGEVVELRYTITTVEVVHKGERVASHIRSVRPGQHTTDPAHMPESHRRHAEWTPSRILDWAGKTGPETARLAEAILTDRRHPEQGFRSCLGILRLSKKYTPERLEAACARAYAGGARSYRSVKSILEKGLDHLPALPFPAPPLPSLDHENVRGQAYYQ
jgi:transposase